MPTPPDFPDTFEAFTPEQQERWQGMLLAHAVDPLALVRAQQDYAYERRLRAAFPLPTDEVPDAE